MIARDQVFSDIRIVLDGCSFYRCTFRSCVFVYCASLPVVMESCTYERGCMWEMDRAARHTVDFLTLMYRSGATQAVETAFDLIRGKAPPGTRVM